MDSTRNLRKTRSQLKPVAFEKDIDSETELISSSYSEEIVSSTLTAPRKYTSRVHTTRHNTSDYSSDDEKHKSNGDTYKHSMSDLSDHQAYKLYREAGEYWNKYPKTDYTYSRYSPHRRELAPGVIAMPNMSRRSIHRDDLSQNTSNSILEKTYKSRFICTNQEGLKRHMNENWGYDETDYKLNETLLQKILRITCITLIYTTIRNWFTSYQYDHYRTPVNRRSRISTVHLEEIKWYQKIWHSIISIFEKLTIKFYTLLGNLLLLDCWLLQKNTVGVNERQRVSDVQQHYGSEISTTRANKWKLFKRLLLFLLISLLLLFIGYFYGINYDIKNNLPELSIPDISLPKQINELAHTSQAAFLDTLEFTKMATNNYYNHLYQIISDNINYFNNKTSIETNIN